MVSIVAALNKSNAKKRVAQTSITSQAASKYTSKNLNASVPSRQNLLSSQVASKYPPENLKASVPSSQNLLSSKSQIVSSLEGSLTDDDDELNGFSGPLRSIMVSPPLTSKETQQLQNTSKNVLDLTPSNASLENSMENEATSDTENDVSKTSSAFKSVIWQSFSKVQNAEFIECMICKKKYQYKKGGSTSAALRHLKTIHQKVVNDFEETKKQKSLSEMWTQKNDSEKLNKYQWKVPGNTYEDNLVKFAITSNISFRTFNNSEFKAVIKSLNPSAISPSASTMKRKVSP